VLSVTYKKVFPPIVSVQKKPNPKLFNAASNPERFGENVMVKVRELTTIVAEPHDKFMEDMFHEYLVVALIEN
jgi:hypothetical protein